MGMDVAEQLKKGAVIVELATFYQFDADAMTSSRISVDL